MQLVVDERRTIDHSVRRDWVAIALDIVAKRFRQEYCLGSIGLRCSYSEEL
jgi:hypothetical protein